MKNITTLVLNCDGYEEANVKIYVYIFFTLAVCVQELAVYNIFTIS